MALRTGSASHFTPVEAQQLSAGAAHDGVNDDDAYGINDAIHDSVNDGPAEACMQFGSPVAVVTPTLTLTLTLTSTQACVQFGSPVAVPALQLKGFRPLSIALAAQRSNGRRLPLTAPPPSFSANSPPGTDENACGGLPRHAVSLPLSL